MPNSTNEARIANGLRRRGEFKKRIREERRTDVSQLKARMLAHITSKELGVTFIALQNALETDFDVTGTLTLWKWNQGIVWTAMSQTFADALQSLFDEGLIVLESCPPHLYYIDGAYLNLPVAKRPPRDKDKGYAKVKWVVCCLGARPLSTEE